MISVNPGGAPGDDDLPPCDPTAAFVCDLPSAEVIGFYRDQCASSDSVLALTPLSAQPRVWHGVPGQDEPPDVRWIVLVEACGIPKVRDRQILCAPVEFAATLLSHCLILGKQAFTLEVPMDDPNDPFSRENLSWNWRFGGSKWRPFTGRVFRGPRIPPPPGPRPKPSKAEREQERRAEARAERLHLAGLTNAGVIIMVGVLGVALVGLVVVLINHI